MTTPIGQWIGYGLSDIGLIRASNQDALLVLNDHGIWAVADGMGGHAGGDVASGLAVAAIRRLAAEALPSGPAAGSMADAERFLRALVQAANRRVFEESAAVRSLRGMGTTLVVLMIRDSPRPIAHLAHVGDSRAYLYRDGALRLLTRDHSLVEDYIRRGLLTRDQAATHPRRHVLTRAIGLDPTVEAEITQAELEPNDLLILCTDGLTKMLDDRDLALLAAKAGQGPAELSRALIAEANRRG
ncbi:MAG TPA: PP2C family serine/threonine-protein phosphatase, partial [Nitrospiraceae bacterium]|nr:PP2C family serine/threonine-protein phosphatase [Nitrospiraceae bacterium]